MEAIYERTALLVKEEGIEKLKKAKVLIFGVGGVGGFVCESLVRAGVGTITIVDKDVVDATNINRQIIATSDTIGQPKVEVMARRIKTINSSCNCNGIQAEVTQDNLEDIVDFSDFDFVVDAIDNVSGKIGIILKAKEKGVAVISSMGAGNRLSNREFFIDDISKSRVCPLAKVIRKKLKDLGVTDVPVLYSTGNIIKKEVSTVGSISYVPATAGLYIAGYVVEKILKL